MTGRAFIVGLWIILGLVLLAAPAAAQETSGQKFVRITHSADGTTAVDSVGVVWHYDADRGEFVPGEGAGRKTAVDRGDEDTVEEGIELPAEVRCTNIHEGDISRLFSEVVVETDERVTGAVFSGRDVIVKGLVDGDVVSLKTVTVTSTGEVRGNVIAKEIRRDRGGRILGQQSKVPLPVVTGWSTPGVFVLPWLVTVAFIGFVIFITVIVIALVPKAVGRVAARVNQAAVKSFFIGLLGWFSIIPVFALLIITIVGIPIALLAFPLILVGAVVLAVAAAAIFIGERLCPLLHWEHKSTYMKAICGIIAVELLDLAASLFGSLGAYAIHYLFLALYVIVVSVAVTVGFGAVISTRFGTRSGPPAPKTDGSAAGQVPAPLVSPPPPVTPPPGPKNATE
jgi:hypothetical protein